MLHLDIGIGERLLIGDAVVTLIEKSGRKARVSVAADPSIMVRLEHTKITHHHAEQAPRRAGTKP